MAGFTSDPKYRIQYIYPEDMDEFTFSLMSSCNHSIVFNNYGAAAAVLNSGETSFPAGREEFRAMKENFGNWYDI